MSQRLHCKSVGIITQVCVKLGFALLFQVVEDGYEFFAKRQLVTLFSAPNYCGEFDNAGGMMSVDESLMCSFQVSCQFVLWHGSAVFRHRTRYQQITVVWYWPTGSGALRWPRVCSHSVTHLRAGN